MTDRLFHRIEVLAAWIVFPCFVGTILLNVSFYWIGSLRPDPATNRIFAVHEHGTLYVVPSLGIASLILFWVGFGTLVALFGVGMWKRRLNSN